MHYTRVILVSPREETTLTRDILDPGDITRADIDQIFARADEITNTAPSPLRGKSIALALYAANDGTLARVEENIHSLGGISRPLHRLAKIADLIKEADALGVAAVMFDLPERDSTASLVSVHPPLLSLGDGTNENPVRALMDLYAISKEMGTLDGRRVALLGNLKFGAEAHSLARFLSLFRLSMSLVSPAALSMPYDLTDDLRANGVEVEETNDLPSTLRKSDVLYLSRLDPIRMEAKVYEKTRKLYVLAPSIFAEAKPGLFVLGEWDGAEEILEPSRRGMAEVERAMLGALLEFAMP